MNSIAMLLLSALLGIADVLVAMHFLNRGLRIAAAVMFWVALVQAIAVGRKL